MHPSFEKDSEVQERDGLCYQLTLVSDLRPGMRTVAWDQEGTRFDDVIESVRPGTIYTSSFGPSEGFYIQYQGREHVSSAGRFYRAAVVIENTNTEEV